MRQGHMALRFPLASWFLFKVKVHREFVVVHCSGASGFAKQIAIWYSTGTGTIL
jgi:hypothetical protein